MNAPSRAGVAGVAAALLWAALTSASAPPAFAVCAAAGYGGTGVLACDDLNGCFSLNEPGRCP
jgi:hypothetical protein